MRPFGYKSRKEPIRSSSVQVRRESKDHATLSDLYLNNVISRLTHISEDSARLLKRVRGGGGHVTRRGALVGPACSLAS